MIERPTPHNPVSPHSSDGLEAENRRLREQLEAAHAIQGELEAAQSRIAHLNAVIRAVRNVNQLITREKDRQSLLDQACRQLTETRGYTLAWIVLFDEQNQPVITAVSGGNVTRKEIWEIFETPCLPHCTQSLLESNTVVYIDSPPTRCRACQLATAPPLRNVLSVLLTAHGRLFGQLTVAVPKTIPVDDEETDLVRELAEDLAFALAAIDNESARSRAEEQVRESEVRYRELFDTMRSGVAVYTAVDDGRDFVFVDFNRGAERIEGISRDHVCGKRLTEMFPTVEEFGLLGVMKRVYRTGEPEHYPATIYRDDRICGWRDNSVYRLPSGEVVAIYDDVTEQREAESALRESESLYRTLVKASPDAIITASLKGRITYASPRALALYGYDDPSELVGTYALDLLEPVFRTAAIRSVKTLLEEGAVTTQVYHHRRRDGTTFHGETTAAVTTGSDGTATGIISVTRDVTAREEAVNATRKLAAELETRVQQRTRALAAANQELESFAYSVSHDLRAPLRAINYFAHELLEDHAEGLDDDGIGTVNRIAEATRQMSDLISAILDLSRVSRQEVRRVDVDLAKMTRDVADELHFAHRRRAVQVRINKPMIGNGDPELLRQMLQNLLDNAWKFTAKKNPALLEAGVTETEHGPTFYIRDNGVGFDMTFHNKLFAPFQRLHPLADFSGAGVGLATVQRIIQRHGGKVWAHGTVGEGATFFFTLK